MVDICVEMLFLPLLNMNKLDLFIGENKLFLSTQLIYFFIDESV